MSLQQYFGKHDANWNVYASKEQRGTKLTVGFLSLILALGSSLWIAQGVYLQYTSLANSPVCREYDGTETKSTRFCMGHWTIYVNGHHYDGTAERSLYPYFAWHKVHILITFGMGLMYVAINYLWWMWEKGLVTKYTSGFTDKAIPTMTNNGEHRHADVRTDTLNYVVRFLTNTKHFYWYAVKYLAIIALTFAVLTFQLYYLHTILNADLDFDSYTKLYENLLKPQDERMQNPNDVAVMRFPINFHCYRNFFGKSGSMQTIEVNCDNEANGWVEAFYISNIYVLFALLVLWLINLLQTLFSIIFFKQLTGISQYKSSQFKNFDMGKKLMFLFMAQNFEPLFWNDVITAIKDTPMKQKPQNNIV
jgi:hypothetical protein